MKKISKLQIEKFFVIFMSFFIFSGYYCGLTIVLSSGNDSYTRFYSVPIRILQFLVTVFCISKSYKRSKESFINFLMFLFFILYFLKVLYTETLNINDFLSKKWYEYIFYYILYSYSIYLFFRNLNVYKYLNLIVKTLLFSGFLFGILLILFYRDIFFISQVGRFGSSIEDNEATLISPLAVAYSGALNISLLIPFLKNNFYKINFFLKLYYLLNFFLSMFMFVMGSTRGALVVVVISLILFLFTTKGKDRLKYLFIIFLIFILFIFYLDLTGSSLLKRFDGTIEKQNNGGRDLLWDSAINEFVDNVIFGGRIEVSQIYPHNIILEILMSMGIFGFLLFMFILFISFKKFKLNNNTIYIYIIFFNGFFQHMFSGSIYLAIILFFGIGLINGYKLNDNES